ncbi:MAG: right-handed parallel beta-helix repeat-containing protein [Planctomycetota bacterium]
MRVFFSVLSAFLVANTALTAQIEPLVPAPDPDALPILHVIADNTKITESCVIRLGARTVIEDTDGNGVLHIMTEGITVEFEDGSVLRGAPRTAELDTLQGIGIRLDQVREVTLRNVRVSGYRCGILATGAHLLKVEGARLVRNYAQALGSTAQAEDPSDWLWPHENDASEWWQNYGAGICVQNSNGVELNNIYARNQQNGILLDRVQIATLLNNDCSYLSGWGLAMWRSSNNTVRNNRFDFCIRGYSDGVYNRGQDSAGILMFEQCHNNLIQSNSASFCGDGIFAFAGREALGEKEPLDEFLGYARVGNNGNQFVRNRLNYNAAHGLELTFSFDNLIVGNEFIGNAICGIWGGYSQSTGIFDNHFRKNGDAGYGLERGGINIDHARLTHIHGNRFESDAAGVHLWNTSDAFDATPWGLANNLNSDDNLVHGNEFRDVAPAIHLRGGVKVAHHANTYLDLEGAEVEDSEAVLVEGGATWITSEEVVPPTPMPFELADVDFGRPSAYHGRHNIVMTPWGPWDHKSKQWIRVGQFAKHDLYRAYPADLEPKFKFLEGAGKMIVREVPEKGNTLGKLFQVRPSMRGFQAYRLSTRTGEGSFLHDGLFLGTPWSVKHFASPVDPREDVETWRAAAAAPECKSKPMDDLKLHFGMDGPEVLEATDHFGTIATLNVPLPEAGWTITTRSDDGIRVWVDEELVIDDWTHHGATRHDYSFQVETRRLVKIRVEHFELDGAAMLEVQLQRDR